MIEKCRIYNPDSTFRKFLLHLSNPMLQCLRGGCIRVSFTPAFVFRAHFASRRSERRLLPALSSRMASNLAPDLLMVQNMVQLVKDLKLPVAYRLSEIKNPNRGSDSSTREFVCIVHVCWPCVPAMHPCGDFRRMTQTASSLGSCGSCIQTVPRNMQSE